MPLQLAGAGVVVTGAAGGIGFAMAQRFAAAGARVVLNDINSDACRAAADALGCSAVPGDAASAAGVQALVAAASDHLGEIDLFCANAGVELGGVDTDEVWQSTWEVNVMSHVRAFRELAPRWLERGHGRFLATVSAAGLLMMPGAAAYTATKQQHSPTPNGWPSPTARRGSPFRRCARWGCAPRWPAPTLPPARWCSGRR